MNPDCYMGDHLWSGTSTCSLCGARLRCNCGAYVREDNLDAHLVEKCRSCPPAATGCANCGGPSQSIYCDECCLAASRGEL